MVIILLECYLPEGIRMRKTASLSGITLEGTCDTMLCSKLCYTLPGSVKLGTDKIRLY